LSDIYHILLTTSHRAKATLSPKRCSWFHQCWRMPNTLTRHEPSRLFSLGHLARTCVRGA